MNVLHYVAVTLLDLIWAQLRCLLVAIISERPSIDLEDFITIVSVGRRSCLSVVAVVVVVSGGGRERGGSLKLDRRPNKRHERDNAGGKSVCQQVANGNQATNAHPAIQFKLSGSPLIVLVGVHSLAAAAVIQLCATR